jgi:hypothetical protein
MHDNVNYLFDKVNYLVLARSQAAAGRTPMDWTDTPHGAILTRWMSRLAPRPIPAR